MYNKIKPKPWYRRIQLETVVVLSIVAMVGIFVLVVAHGYITSGELTYGLNGFTEGRCLSGYKFIVGPDGSARQILDELGKGVRC